ncbi:MAG TPA: LysM peptidoglycan-binding domain-containing protein [Ilumatobacteraceae bacterium]|nr:LysM peptidoglycan-binding domain-containing protein [Ilumatobacteraceae bacterium]
MHLAGSRSTARLLASLIAVAAIACTPIVLIWVGRRRFGAASPSTGVDPPWRWDATTIRDALTDRLTESVIVDVIIRIALTTAWVAVAVILITIVAETAHMARHGGMALPSVRGLGWSQRFARCVATGLLVMLPTTHAPRAEVHAVPVRATIVSPALVTSRPMVVPMTVPAESPASTTTSARYTVRAGDSVYEIAQRLTGADRRRTVTVAEQILDLNLGTVMNDGQRFTNAAYIEPGWVLALPSGPTPRVAGTAASEPTAVHIVEPGETLWSIAGDELGVPTQWPEIWDHNRGETMVDGRVFDDPDLILPGWALDVPVTDGPVGVPHLDARPVAGPAIIVAPAPPTPTVPPATTTTPLNPPAATLPPAAASIPPAVSYVPSPPANGAAPTLPAPSTSGASSDSAQPTAVGDLGDVTAMIDGRRLFGLEHAAMLSVGVLTVVGVHRLRRLRAARPRARVPLPSLGALTTERALRTIGADERLLRVDIAVRAAASQLCTRDRQILAVIVDEHGAVEIVLTAPCPADAPFVSSGDRWHLAAATVTDSLVSAARPVGAPCVSLVQLGVTADGRDLYVDLEALTMFSVDAATDRADAVVTAIAATLGTSVLAEVSQLVGVGIDPAAFVGHRHHVGCESFDAALDLATSLLGSTALATESTFALRTRVVGGEAWEPAIVLVASDFADEVGDALPDQAVPGLAVVVAGSVDNARHTLIDNGSMWRLEPLDIDVVPLGLDRAELTAITELVANAAAGLEAPDDAQAEGAGGPDSAPIPTWSLLVRLLGPVDVVDERGCSVDFERSKTRELIAWLATHRGRSTRTLARTALWELDVRDATFSNVVSEARRAMARLVEPALGEEWLGRTLTEDLPLHDQVRTDAELVEHRLAMARRLGPDEAIDVLRPAVEMIRGMPFEGTSYLWPDAEGLASNLVLLATSAASELARHHLALGQIDAVFWATGQGLRVLPGHEDLIALRMRAHAVNGDLASVRHEWQSYERVIAADPWSDGEPAPKLVELRHQLLSPCPAPDAAD